MSGFYDHMDEDKNIKKTVVGAILAASLVFLVFLLLLYKGTGSKQPKNTASSDTAVPTEEEEDLVIGKSNKTSKDFDFWDMFRTDDTPEEAVKDESEGKPAVFTEQGPKPDRIEEDTSDPDTNWETGNPNEGTHIALTDEKGEKTWYEILDIPKSVYSATFIKETDDGMLTYDDNKQKAVSGATLNSDSATVDMKALKDAGIDHVMLRAIQRNGENGAVVPDMSFANLAAAAQGEDLFVGVYVDSAAITTDEAVEEANYAIASATSVGAKYPVVISLPDRSSGPNRMSNLSNVERTKIVQAFCDQVRSFGMKPMIHATKDVLISRLNMEDLVAYDVWVTDQGEKKDGYPYFTDYPYVYTMWGYGNASNVSKINAPVELDLSFVNYEQH
ncbi:MAG: hypothetical protein K6E16_09205 [Lachnospiraceae bacterium]|nr:hypothetical protein [Lachnospiraceae bacterium]